jgi:major membrane immunogen (membrane-anchored lipoprotein)
MRRIALWFLSTAAVVALLFGYDTSTSGPEPAASETVVAAPAAPGSSGTGSSGTGSSDTESSDSGSTGTGSSGAGSSGGSAGTGSSGSGSSGSGAATTVAGSVASTRWGDVQVTITVTDGKITAVDVPEYPTANGKDRQINASALPILKQETLSAQSADIDMVSGATVTSEGYVESLQSALDEAGL